MEKKRIYRVHTQYIFNGVYELVAENREEAQQKVREACGLVMGGNIHSTLPEEEVDWNFDIHSDVKIGRITLRKKEKRHKG